MTEDRSGRSPVGKFGSRLPNLGLGAADALADVLAAVMVPVAQRSERVSSTAPTPEVVDLVVDLVELSRYLVEHTRRVMSGEPAHDWAEVADALAAATKACRRLVVLDLDDAGDAGSR